MFQILGKHGASIPLLSIAVAIVIGAIAVWITPLYKLLNKVQKSVTNIGRSIGYIMVPRHRHLLFHRLLFRDHHWRPIRCTDRDGTLSQNGHVHFCSLPGLVVILCLRCH